MGLSGDGGTRRGAAASSGRTLALLCILLVLPVAHTGAQQQQQRQRQQQQHAVHGELPVAAAAAAGAALHTAADIQGHLDWHAAQAVHATVHMGPYIRITTPILLAGPATLQPAPAVALLQPTLGQQPPQQAGGVPTGAAATAAGVDNAIAGAASVGARGEGRGGGGRALSATVSSATTWTDNTVMDCAGSAAALIITGLTVSGAITITNVTFANCVGAVGDKGGAVRVYNTASNTTAAANANIRFVNCVWTNNVAGRGAAVYMEQVTQTTLAPFASVAFSGCTFFNNSATSLLEANTTTDNYYPLELYGGGAVMINSGSLDACVIGVSSCAPVSFTDCNFTSNSADRSGGAVYINGNSSYLSAALFESCLFRGNTATKGPAFYGGNNTEVPLIDNCLVEYNTCELHGTDVDACGAICSDEYTTGAIKTISNSVFRHNGGQQCATGGALDIETASSSVLLQNLTFNNNTAWDLGGAVFVNSTGQGITLVDCNFTSNGGTVRGGALSVVMQAQLSMIRGYFFNNSASLSGGAIDMYQCASISFDHVKVVNNTAPQGGGANQDRQGTTVFTNSDFTGNYGQYGGGFNGGRDSDLYMTNCTFLNNVGWSYAGGVECRECNSATISGCNFTGNLALPGSGGGLALYAVQSDTTIADSVFVNNAAATFSQDTFYIADRTTAGAGGGMAITLSGNITVRNVTLQGNNATMGGGIYVSRWCPAEVTSACNFSTLHILADTTFIGNTALGGPGGAMFVVHSDALWVDCADPTVAFTPGLSDAGTTAAYLKGLQSATNGVAPLPKTGCPHWSGNTAVLAQGGVMATSFYYPWYINTSITVPNYESNSDLYITIGLYDLWGQLTGPSGPSSNGTTLNFEIVSQRFDAADNVVAQLSGSSSFVSTNGVVKTDGYLGVQSRPGNVTLDIELTFAAGSPATLYSNMLPEIANITLVTRHCVFGEVTTLHGLACSNCSAGFFSLNPLNTSCDLCPLNGVCNSSQGNVLLPPEGWWHSHPYSPQFFQCKSSKACAYYDPERALVLEAVTTAWANSVQWLDAAEVLGVDYSSVNQAQCNEGHTGNLCGECLEGYGHTAIGACSKCPSVAVNTAYVLLSYLLTVVLIFFTVRATLMKGLSQAALDEIIAMRPGSKTAGRARTLAPALSWSEPTAGRASQKIRPSGLLGSRPGADAPEDPSRGWLSTTRGKRVQPLSAEADANPTRGPRGVGEAIEAPVGGPPTGYGHASPSGLAASTHDDRPLSPHGHPQQEEDGQPGQQQGKQGQQQQPGQGQQAQQQPERPARQEHGGKGTKGGGDARVTVAEVPRPAEVRAQDSSAAFARDDGIEAQDGKDGKEEKEEEDGDTERPSDAKKRRRGLGSLIAGDLARERAALMGRDEEAVDARRKLIMRPPHAIILKILINYLQVVAIIRDVGLAIPDYLKSFFNVSGQASAAVGTMASLDCSLSASVLNKALQATLITFSLPWILVLLSLPIWLLLWTLQWRAKTEKEKTGEEKEKAREASTVALLQSRRGAPSPAAGAASVHPEQSSAALLGQSIAPSDKSSTNGDASGAATAAATAATAVAGRAGSRALAVSPSGLLGKNPERETMREYLPPRIIVTTLSILFYLYPNVCNALLSLFQCPNLDASDVAYSQFSVAQGQFWLLSLSVPCYKGKHLAFALILGVPGIILFCLGIPILSAFFLRMRKGLLNDPEFSLRFGFLYEDYNREAYAWESVILLRKLALVIAAVFLASISTTLQLAVMMAIVIVALTAQVWTEPYELRHMNQLESASLSVTVVTYYLLMLVVINKQPGPQQTFSLILVILNVFFLVYIVRALLLAFYFVALKELDADGDGQVSKEEIMAYLRQRMGWFAPVAAALTSLFLWRRIASNAPGTVQPHDSNADDGEGGAQGGKDKAGEGEGQGEEAAQRRQGGAETAAPHVVVMTAGEEEATGAAAGAGAEMSGQGGVAGGAGSAVNGGLLPHAQSRGDSCLERASDGQSVNGKGEGRAVAGQGQPSGDGHGHAPGSGDARASDGGRTGGGAAEGLQEHRADGGAAPHGEQAHGTAAVDEHAGHQQRGRDLGQGGGEDAEPGPDYPHHNGSPQEMGNGLPGLGAHEPPLQTPAGAARSSGSSHALNGSSPRAEALPSRRLPSLTHVPNAAKEEARAAANGVQMTVAKSGKSTTRPTLPHLPDPGSPMLCGTP